MKDKNNKTKKNVTKNGLR